MTGVTTMLVCYQSMLHSDQSASMRVPIIRPT
ncbi:protein of unknown function [Pararobbsia alpina]